MFKLTIDYYGNRFNAHYFGQPLRYMVYKGYSVLPHMEPITEDKLKVFDDGNKILCTPSDPYAKLEELLDNDNTTRWETTSSNIPRRYEMMMELLEETEIRGIKIAQALYSRDWIEKPRISCPLRSPCKLPSDGAHLAGMSPSSRAMNWAAVQAK